MKQVWIGMLMLGMAMTTRTAWSVGGAPSDAEIRKQLQVILMDCDEENGIAVSSSDEAIFFAAEPERVLAVFHEFEQNPSACKRYYVLTRSWQVLQTHPSPEWHQRLFERLILAICTETDDNNAAYFYGLVKASLAGVNFTEETTGWIRQALAAKRPRREVILLAGIANLTDQIPRLAALRMSDEHYAALANEDGVVPALLDEVGWNARLALARLGSREDIQFCIDHIEAITDREVLVMARLGDYGYIRQPETIALLQKYLESDEIIVEGGDDVPRTGTSWYARRILAEILEGFPATGSLAEARAWMRAQTAFKIKR